MAKPHTKYIVGWVLIVLSIVLILTFLLLYWRDSSFKKDLTKPDTIDFWLGWLMIILGIAFLIWGIIWVINGHSGMKQLTYS